MTTSGRTPERLPVIHPTRRAFLSRCRTGTLAALAATGSLASRPRLGPSAENEVLPKHVTPEALRAVVKGLDFLAAQQADDGSWITGGGQAYPVAMTGLAGMAFLAH